MCGTMTGKGRELADMMERRKVDILCVQETRWKGSKARSIGAGFKLFYYGVDSKRNGVGVVLKEEFVRNVLEVKRVSDRVMNLKLEFEGVMLNVVSGYAPQVGCELEEKERFWSELDEVMESIPTGERVVIGADFNGHVGEGNTGDEEVMGKFEVKERNLEGQMVVDFAKRMDMAVVNTYFQKREEHRVTYKSGGRRTQVDYILCRRGNLKEISDCKVVVGESVARQHRMVVCRMTLMVCKTKRSKIEKKTKWWKLKKEECCEEFRQKLRQALGGQVVLPDDWETTAEVIRETGRKVLGVSSGRRKEDKETWWWNEEVQDSIQRKRLAKKKWDMDRTEENRQEYKELQRRVKREVSKAKQKAYEELYTRLDTREGEKDLYRLARQRDRDGKDVQQVRVIKDRDGRVLTSEESVQRRWKEYFEELMNEENEREKRVERVNSVEQKVDKIRKDEVRKALKRMKSGKAVGPDDIPVEVWKCLGEAAVEFLANLFNRVLENLEKAYDRVPREELWYCMRKSGVAEKYVRVVQDMYERSRTVVRCAVGQTEEFNVEVGLHQGSVLSPFLFAIVMDQLSEEVRQESPWTMMFADDIVICSESREQVEENLERWRFALERRGMKVSRSKTEYMCVNEREGSGTVRLQGEEVKKVQEFKYLGSTVQSNGESGKEVKKRVQAGWNGWRKVSGVLCDRKISASIKGKVYRTVVRLAMLYGLETVSLRKRQESELEVAELKMLRFSLGVTRLDRIRNEYIRGTAHVGRLGDKVREARLRWFGHVQRREMSPRSSCLPMSVCSSAPSSFVPVPASSPHFSTIRSQGSIPNIPFLSSFLSASLHPRSSSPLLGSINTPNCSSLSPCLLSRNRRSDRSSMDPSSNPPDPLQDLVAALRQVLAALPDPAPTPSVTTSTDNVTASSAPLCSSPMAQLAPYSGSAEDCNGFLLQCSLVLEMQPHLYPTARSKVAFVISQLRGQALLWAESLWSQDSPVTQSYAGFIEHFKEVFGKPSWDSLVGEELCKLRQGKLTVTEYAIQFRILATKSGWNEQALLAAYRQGLSPQLRLHPAAHEDAIGLESGRPPRLWVGGQLRLRHPLPPARTKAVATPYQIRCITRKPVSRRRVHHSASPVLFQVGLLHVEETTFLVLEESTADIILGRLWLEQHKPILSWSTGEVLKWGNTCFQGCFPHLPAPHSPTSIPLPIQATSIESPLVNQPLQIPTCYAPFSDVFCPKRASKLPPHRPLTADLLPGEPVPRGRIYPLSVLEEEAMEDYIKEALAQNYIRLSTSPAALSFFFMAKRDGGL
ncbi:hypothetical protein QTP86_007525 [Hemibagrus guttatus]|nr:hypothetical protein QTP86_007525 [Hemibagrus guttatus]